MDAIFHYLTSSDLSAGFAYFIIFAILFVCGLGFPLPEDVPLVATGYLIWDGTITWIPSLIVTLSGVLVGDIMLFFLGQRLGLSILRTQRFQKVFKPEKVERTRAYFRKYGDKIVFFARFVAGFRAIAFFMSGAMHMRFRKFIFLDTLAALLSVPLWIALGQALGHFYGDELSKIMQSMREVKTGFTIVILIVVTIVSVRFFMQYRRAKKA